MEKTKWTHSDREALNHLMGAIHCLGKAESMEKRMRSVPRGLFRYRGGLTHLSALFADLLATMPPEQLMHYKRQLEGLGVTIGIRNVYKPTDLYGRFLTFDEIRTLIEASHDRCVVCMMSDADQRKCKLRQLLDNLPQGEAGDETDERYGSTGCKYSVLQ